MRAISGKASLRDVIQAVQELATGGSNAHGMFTLAPNATTTTVSDQLASTSSRIILTPTTADAAAAGVFVSAKANGSFTITHASSATTDRTFDYLILH